jgi:hypothetical protein
MELNGIDCFDPFFSVVNLKGRDARSSPPLAADMSSIKPANHQQVTIELRYDKMGMP